jgi:hypothetical protein
LFEKLKISEDAKKITNDLELKKLIDRNPFDHKTMAKAMRIVVTEGLIEEALLFEKALEGLHDDVIHNVIKQVFSTDGQKIGLLRDLQELYDEFWEVIGLPDLDQRKKLFKELVDSGAFDWKKALKSWEQAKSILQAPAELLFEKLIWVLRKNADHDKRELVEVAMRAVVSTLDQYLSRAILHSELGEWKEAVRSLTGMAYALQGAISYVVYEPE